MKKILKTALLMLMCAALFTGCVRIDMPDPQPQTVFASFYPVYALAEGIVRGVPNLSLGCIAQPQDGCIRSYSLSDWDAALVSGADLFIIGGRGLESWESALASGSVPVLTAMENMPLIGADEAVSDESGHFVGPNPWFFLSVDGARSITAAIAGGMSGLDPDFADLYAENLAAMNARFDALEADIDLALAGVGLPGAILMQEGLCYFAQEAGVPAYIEIEREAGADMSDIEFADALSVMSESGYTLVLIERQAPQGLVRALESEGYTVVLIDILTDHSLSEGPDGYFTAMLQNAQALAGALR